MGFRFSRHVGILPGLRVNLSKSGVSLSAGVRGAHITVGRTPRITLGIPGSGISWTETMEHGRRAPQGAPQPVQPRSGWAVLGWVAFLLFVLVMIIGGGGH